MSRITDTERGAGIALRVSQDCVVQPDLFPSALPVSYWDVIVVVAYDQLQECKALRETGDHG